LGIKQFGVLLIVLEVAFEMTLIVVKFKSSTDVLAVVIKRNGLLLLLLRLCSAFVQFQIVFIEILLNLFPFLESSEVLIAEWDNNYMFSLILP
jgi:hypothetical protein